MQQLLLYKIITSNPDSVPYSGSSAFRYTESDITNNGLPPLAVLIFEFPQSAVFLGVNGQLRRVGQVVEVKRIKSAFGNRDLPEIDIVAVADITAS